MSNTENIRKLLPFWSHLSKEEIERIEISLIEKSFSKGELVSQNSNSCEGMIIVEKGDIRVSIISEEGKQITLFHVSDNEVCVMSASCVIAKLTFETVINAQKDTKIFVIPSATLDFLIDNNIHVKAKTYELLVERFSTVVRVMEQILFKRIDHRIADFLLSHYKKTKNKEIKMTQEEIAFEINTAREVVARILKQFAFENLVELKRGKIILKDIDKLKALFKD
ncbi:CRP/FNR family transcriptional regulator, anaerobic regulatory protein [Acetitomaculum ruminis DSM 5522]|uniref:CRP/FNR family transcriptional regulator, anaerobic regulatory protein n=1 Tax=Acetitomaculum ruminis DSM 5522 TaxID=1120918 RepID=A0A1I0ZYH6_9FIRM|nr:Crp/Fnr family transcriptional regulator [Acetitomaculum ruminis]SFB29123.1 CRP/FNR family transcriptional regulator, anaerobic regulatory protein [Acetitomaculum ruminis DSM 5522]